MKKKRKIYLKKKETGANNWFLEKTMINLKLQFSCKYQIHSLIVYNGRQYFRILRVSYAKLKASHGEAKYV